MDGISMRERQDLVDALNQRAVEVADELSISRAERFSLEMEAAESDQMVKDLELNLVSALERLEKYQSELDKAREELRKKQEEDAWIGTLLFPLCEIEEATDNFAPSSKIGEGGFGSVYKGCLRHTEVAIKTLDSQSLQGPSEFRQEVTILSKMRHPNLVTLIGACPEACALIYEYLPNGSLEDRLSCRDNTPPLSWQTRIRIAAELCSVLIFLHSDGIVHGDLKPENILLDANYVCKLTDFGIGRVITRNESFSNNSTLIHMTQPKGTAGYVDPEFIATGELNRMSDVYAVGIILLRLLTGKPAMGIRAEMTNALRDSNLNNVLDPTVKDWPFVQAQQLAQLAMRCSDTNRRNRPDLASEVWRLLEPMRKSCDVSSFRASSERNGQIPPYFMCPIFQDIMQDPYVAADGYTYELEALRGWLDSGNDTSPVTNLKLPDRYVVSNHSLRSAIQEWQQLQR